jgi:hypothetical protein
VHWYRNIFSHVPSTKVREIAAMLKAIHAGKDILAARQKAVQVIEKMRGLRLINAAELVAIAQRDAVPLTATYPRRARSVACRLQHQSAPLAARVDARQRTGGPLRFVPPTASLRGPPSSPPNRAMRQPSACPAMAQF